jgi:hypothetical protein
MRLAQSNRGSRPRPASGFHSACESGTMDKMLGTAITRARRRWYGVAFGIVTGLLLGDDCFAWAENDPYRRPASGLHFLAGGGESTPPSFRKRPVAEGVVARYLLDPRGEIEGLLLKDGSQMYITSRASDKLLQAIKPGHHVRVHGRRLDGAPLVQADVILNTSTGTIFTVPFRLDFPIPDQEQHLSMTEMKAEGTIEVLLFHVKGIVQGMLLSDGTQVRLPPDINDELRNSFRVGEHIMAEGNGTANEYGRCLEALMMSVDGGRVIPLDSTVTRLR